MRNILLSFLSIGFFYSISQAEYVATGQIEGNVCNGFIIEWCQFHEISAIKGDDGQLYPVNKIYESVSEYKPEKNLCWVYTKSQGCSILSWSINKMVLLGFCT